jgi:hypothetical protein
MRLLQFFAFLLYINGCQSNKHQSMKLETAQSILENKSFSFVKEKARTIVSSGFNAGDGYGEVWIRDYNTFIELSMEVYPPEVIEENLLVFFRLQGEDGNIVDGFIPRSKEWEGGYEYIRSDLEPRYSGHKNTVETDQESSLVQAVHKYIQKSGNPSLLETEVGGAAVKRRLEQAMQFLLDHRFNQKFGLLWGATTADWGDVQPEHDWGVYLTEDTHYAIDIYDNAMFIIALDNLMDLMPAKKEKWQPVRDQIFDNCRKHLWDDARQKFIPHLYLESSPFPKDFDEHQIYYHGGTAVAIEAGLLDNEEIQTALSRMVENVEAVGAASIGLTMYPSYPEGYFKNKGMYPYGYQNGGDWTWFGGRMIQQLARNGYVVDAYEHILPMTERVVVNDGFFEWYTIENEPRGSGTFRGSAGVLYQAILMLESWARAELEV